VLPIPHTIAVVELLGPGLAIIVAIIIFWLLLHFLENRDSDGSF
jgi:hypothetical protein